MTLLKADALGVRIGARPLLEGVSFSLGKGQRLGIIGATGAGKSLLLLAVAGLLPAGTTLTGSLSLDEAPVPGTGEPAQVRGTRIGVLPQRAGDDLDPMMRIGDQLAEAFAAPPQPIEGSAATTLPPLGLTVEQLLEDVGLDPALANRFPYQLTYGERQRAMLAAALAASPDLLVADDPTAGLDPIEQRAVVTLIERLCAEREMALLFTSPDLKLVALLATRVLVLKDGKAIESGDRADVFGHPRHPHTRLLMTAGRHRAKTLMRTPIGAVLLEARNVGRAFRDLSTWPRLRQAVAVEDVSFTIRQAESLALIGPSGAGKSTLARIVAGLETATAGELAFDHATYRGRDLPLLQRGGIGFVFPDPRLSFNPRLTVGESIAEPLQLESTRLLDELSERIIEMVTAVGLAPDLLGRLPGDFAVAELQLLALARALITRPRLIVFDDPMRGLDVAARGIFAVLLNRLRADFGLTFLVVSPDFELVRVIADRVLVMDEGRIVETGTPSTLMDRPQHAVTQRLVAAALPDVGIVPVF